MKTCFPRTSRLPKMVTLVALTLGMAVGSWLLLVTLTAQAAPPAQPPPQDGVTIMVISHSCTLPGLGENPPNDTYHEAALLQAGQPQTHTLDSGGQEEGTRDKDWFEFTVPAGQVFTLSTTIPTDVLTMTNKLTMTEVSLFTSTETAQEESPAAISPSGELGWVASSSPSTQTFWVQVVNPFAGSQDPTHNFCDVAYNLELRLLGNLAHSGTAKTAESGPGRTLTYTIILSNTGEMLEPVLITDTFPTGVNVLTVTVVPSSVTTELLTTATALSWTGWVSGYSSVQFTINATATKTITDVANTAWITAREVFSRTHPNVTFGPEGVFLPIILKNSS